MEINLAFLGPVTEECLNYFQSSLQRHILSAKRLLAVPAGKCKAQTSQTWRLSDISSSDLLHRDEPGVTPSRPSSRQLE